MADHDKHTETNDGDQSLDDLNTALSEAELTIQARSRYAETSGYAAYWSSRYQRFHGYFAPLNGDQWPEDKLARPGMIHITNNIVGPAVMTESRIESILPRATLKPFGKDPRTRARAEQAEQLLLFWLETSGWDVWLNDAAKTKGIYGKVVLKPLWNKADKRPDVSVIEQLQNLRLGWASSDYTVLDWALYESALSPLEAMRRFPGIEINVEGRRGAKELTVLRHSDHADPLGQLSPTNPSGRGAQKNRPDLQGSDYENKQVTVWDYWAKDKDGNILNAFFVNGVLTGKPTIHNYYPDIPFIVIEHDHEPGSPEGIGDVEPLIDIQYELNRAMSHWAQLIADNIDPAYQVNVESLPGGMVPIAGEIIATGADGAKITPIEKPVNQFPVQQLIEGLMKAFHFKSGLSEILFSLPPGAQTAGRALQIQIESSANRIDPRRKRLYQGLRELLTFWSVMAEKINPEIEVGFDEESGEPIKAGVKDLLQGFRNWQFVAPEITPRDNIEAITAVVNKLNNKLISLEDAMDELGVESPLEMIKKIEAERMNPKLYAGDTQAFVAVLAALQQYQGIAEQMGILPPGGGGAPGGGPGGPTQGDEAQNAIQAQDQASAPQGIQGDNGSGPPQPGTPPGGAPPPGAPGPAGQTLIRAQPGGGAQTLQQIKTTY